MTLGADIVIVSANESRLYLDFWPFVAWAYNAIFPGVRVVLAFVSDRLESDPFVAQLRRHGEVMIIRPVRDIPQAAQAKMARYYVAAQQGDAVCYIEDIDWIPIDGAWYAEKVAQRKPGTVLFVGQEVYGANEHGQAPASMMTGEGHLYRRLFNPDGLTWKPWLRSLARTGKHADIYSRVQHEGMGCTTDDKHLGNQLFSDEALIVQLRRERPVPVTAIKRGYAPGVDTIDRCAWGALDTGKLDRGGYLGAHTARPYREWKAGNDAIWDYIARRYKVPIPVPLTKTPGFDPDMHLEGAFAAAYPWICQNISPETAILEVGSNHESTNYLSRYYELRTITHDLSLANIYPAHYIYAPLRDGGYDPEHIECGFGSYNTYKPHGLLLVNDAAGALSCIGRLPVQQAPVLVTDVGADAQRFVSEAAARSGRQPVFHRHFTVI